MLLERVIGGKLDRRTDEQDRLPLQPGKRDLVDGSDAVDVGRTMRDEEICGVHHAQIDMQRLPIVTGQLRTGLCAVGRILKGPLFAIFVGIDAFFPVFV